MDPQTIFRTSSKRKFSAFETSHYHEERSFVLREDTLALLSGDSCQPPKGELYPELMTMGPSNYSDDLSPTHLLVFIDVDPVSLPFDFLRKLAILSRDQTLFVLKNDEKDKNIEKDGPVLTYQLPGAPCISVVPVSAAFLRDAVVTRFTTEGDYSILANIPRHKHPMRCATSRSPTSSAISWCDHIHRILSPLPVPVSSPGDEAVVPCEPQNTTGPQGISPDSLEFIPELAELDPIREAILSFQRGSEDGLSGYFARAGFVPGSVVLSMMLTTASPGNRVHTQGACASKPAGDTLECDRTGFMTSLYTKSASLPSNLRSGAERVILGASNKIMSATRPQLVNLLSYLESLKQGVITPKQFASRVQAELKDLSNAQAELFGTYNTAYEKMRGLLFDKQPAGKMVDMIAEIYAYAKLLVVSRDQGPSSPLLRPIAILLRIRLFGRDAIVKDVAITMAIELLLKAVWYIHEHKMLKNSRTSESEINKSYIETQLKFSKLLSETKLDRIQAIFESAMSVAGIPYGYIKAFINWITTHPFKRTLINDVLTSSTSADDESVVAEVGSVLDAEVFSAKQESITGEGSIETHVKETRLRSAGRDASALNSLATLLEKTSRLAASFMSTFDEDSVLSREREIVKFVDDYCRQEKTLTTNEMALLYDHLSRAKLLVKELKSGSASYQAMNAQIAKLQKVFDREVTKKINGAKREMPLGIYIYGPPGAGKTTIARVLAFIFSQIKYQNPYKSSDFYCYNQRDAYDSGLFDQRVLLFDDACVTKGDEAAAFVQRMLDVIGTEATFSVQADLDLKGKIVPRPDVVCVTTNASTPDMSRVEPAAISAFWRRMAIRVRLSAAPGRKPSSNPESVSLSDWNATVFQDPNDHGSTRGTPMSGEEFVQFAVGKMRAHITSSGFSAKLDDLVTDSFNDRANCKLHTEIRSIMNQPIVTQGESAHLPELVEAYEEEVDPKLQDTVKHLNIITKASLKNSMGLIYLVRLTNISTALETSNYSESVTKRYPKIEQQRLACTDLISAMVAEDHNPTETEARILQQAVKTYTYLEDHGGADYQPTADLDAMSGDGYLLGSIMHFCTNCADKDAQARSVWGSIRGPARIIGMVITGGLTLTAFHAVWRVFRGDESDQSTDTIENLVCSLPKSFGYFYSKTISTQSQDFNGRHTGRSYKRRHNQKAKATDKFMRTQGAIECPVPTDAVIQSPPLESFGKSAVCDDTTYAEMKEFALALGEHTYRLTVEVASEMSASITIVGIKDSLFITATHFTTMVEEAVKSGTVGKITATNKNGSWEVKLVSVEVGFIGEDVSLLYVEGLPTPPDIVNRFLTHDEIDFFHQYPAILVTPHKYMNASAQDLSKRLSVGGFIHEYGIGTLKVCTVLEGNAYRLLREGDYVVSGNCGSLLIAPVIGTTRFGIVSMHVMSPGNNSLGAGTYVTRELIKELLLAKTEDVVVSNDNSIVMQGSSTYVPIKKRVQKLGFSDHIVSDGFTRGSVYKTRITKARGFRSLGGIKVIPSDGIFTLPTGDLTTPLIEGIFKSLAKTKHVVPQAALTLLDDVYPVLLEDLAHRFTVASQYFTIQGIDVAEFNTREVAISGYPGVVDALKIKTSPGARFSFHTKEGFFIKDIAGGVEQPRQLTPQISKEVDAILEFYADNPDNGVYKSSLDTHSGKIDHSIFGPFSKDEPLKPGKPKRVVYGCDGPTVIALRELLCGIMAIIKADPINTRLGLGLSPLSRQWAQLYNSLCEDGEKTALDHPEFDRSVPHEVLTRASTMIVQLNRRLGLLTERQCRSLTGLLRVCCYSSVAVGDVVLRIGAGLMSGMCGTTLLGGLCNHLMILATLKQCNPELLHSDFSKCVVDSLMVAFSDDYIARYSPLLPPINWVRFAEVFSANFGILPHDGNHNPLHSFELEELTFLKRSFRIGHNNVLCPLDKGSICGIPDYRMEATPEHVHTLAIHEALRYESALHGRDFYNFVETTMLAQKTDMKLPVALVTYEQMMMDIVNTHLSRAPSPTNLDTIDPVVGLSTQQLPHVLVGDIETQGDMGPILSRTEMTGSVIFNECDFGSMPTNYLQGDSLNSDRWTSRAVPLPTITVTTGTPYLTVVNNLFGEALTAASILNRFQNIRALKFESIRVTLRVSSPASQYGTLAAVFLPSYLRMSKLWAELADHNGGTPNSGLLSNPHILMSLGESRVAEITLPFQCFLPQVDLTLDNTKPYDFADYSHDQSSWGMMLFPMGTVANTDGSVTNITIAPFVELIGVDSAIPSSNQVFTTLYTQGGLETPSNIEMLGGAVENTLHVAKRLAPVASAAATAAGLSVPQEVPSHTDIGQTGLGFQNSAKTAANVTASLYPDNRVMPSPGLETNHMSFEHIGGKKFPMTTVLMLNTDVPGDRILTIPATPAYDTGSLSTVTPILGYERMYRHPIAQFLDMYQFYSYTSMELTIVANKPKFTSGGISVSFNAGASNVPSGLSMMTTATQTSLFDFAEGNIFTVSFPWASPLGMLRWNVTAPGVLYSPYSNPGNITIDVTNILAGPELTSIELYLYISFKGIQAAYPTRRMVGQMIADRVPAPVAGDNEKQSGPDDAEPEILIMKNTISGGVTRSPFGSVVPEGGNIQTQGDTELVDNQVQKGGDNFEFTHQEAGPMEGALPAQLTQEAVHNHYGAVSVDIGPLLRRQHLWFPSRSYIDETTVSGNVIYHQMAFASATNFGDRNGTPWPEAEIKETPLLWRRMMDSFIAYRGGITHTARRNCDMESGDIVHHDRCDISMAMPYDSFVTGLQLYMQDTKNVRTAVFNQPVGVFQEYIARTQDAGFNFNEPAVTNTTSLTVPYVSQYVFHPHDRASTTTTSPHKLSVDVPNVFVTQSILTTVAAVKVRSIHQAMYISGADDFTLFWVVPLVIYRPTTPGWDGAINLLNNDGFSRTF